MHVFIKLFRLNSCNNKEKFMKRKSRTKWERNFREGRGFKLKASEK